MKKCLCRIRSLGFLGLTLLAGLCLAWFSLVDARYERFAQVTFVSPQGISYLKNYPGYAVSVNRPTFLQFHGCLALSSPSRQVVLQIHPALLRDNVYSAKIRDGAQWHSLQIDKRLNLTWTTGMDEKSVLYYAQLLSNHYDTLLGLLGAAENQWQL